MFAEVRRHKTAIRRVALSRPIRLAHNAGLIAPNTSVFDYGCGKGDDIAMLVAAGITCSGWDPVHRPHVEPVKADVVNLGYVINVIEDADERAKVLRHAWSLAQRVLLVSARLDVEVRATAHCEFKDGYL